MYQNKWNDMAGGISAKVLQKSFIVRRNSKIIICFIKINILEVGT